MSIESLKEQARRHEQKEEWQKALNQYQKAIAELARDDQPDIGLYNRVGDLYVREGQLEDAVKNYEQAVDLYREAFLPNNAIAVCKKIIRNVPHRHQAYLKMGQIRAEQGFLPDARTNFLTYAERMQKDGDLDESFRALIEFCDLAPDDVGVRITVAEQMAANDRVGEALEQLTVAYRRLTQTGETDLASGVESKIKELDPDADIESLAAASSVGSDGEVVGSFGEIHVSEDRLAAQEANSGFAIAGAEFEDEESEEDVGAELPVMDAAGFEDEDEAAESPMVEVAGLDDDEDEAVELPIMEAAGFEDDEPEAVELPMMEAAGFEDDEEAGAVELPIMEVADFEDDEEEEAVELPIMEAAGFEDDEEEEPVPLSMMDGDEGEEAFTAPAFAGEGEAADAETGLAEVSLDSADAVQEAVEDAASEAIAAPEVPPPPVQPEAPPEPTPVAASEPEYVDLGSMIFGGDDEEEKSTRFQVAYEEPSGDEAADFAKMLSQFKEKVSENLGTDDVQAHHDLGTAYKEMGLLDEAIGEFQAALRASANHLPTYELLGQTFLESGQSEAAVKSLERAVQINTGVEDDLLGIYYYLARAHEDLGNSPSALEFYDRVFALDINFADVTERLRALR